MSSDNSQITEWLSQRPKWIQVAAKRILEFNDINETYIHELVSLCKQETDNCFPEIDYSLPVNSFIPCDSEEIRLRSISDVSGVNRLAPKKPLNFGDNNITIIYGHNGSGKTGYVRLLKHICGARDCIRGKLLADVSTKDDVPKNANISFLKNNLAIKHHWSGEGICDELLAVDIFDSSFSKVFLGAENEVSYEPLALSFFSQLIDVCEKVSEKLNKEEESLVSKMPSMPTTYLGSTGSRWLEQLADRISIDEIENYCHFTKDDESELKNIQERISEQSPAEKANQLQSKEKYINEIISDVNKYSDQFSDEKCKQIIRIKEQVLLKKSVAEAAAKSVFCDSKLGGIGSKIWKELWQAARKYSEELAYVNQEFPFTHKESVCVLCHQYLTDEAKTRLHCFESYVKNETEKQATLAEKEFEQAINDLPDLPSISEMKIKFDAACIENQELCNSLIEAITAFQDRKLTLSVIPQESNLKPIQLLQPTIEMLQKIAQDYSNGANKYLEDSKKDNQDELKALLKDLNAKKWLADQKSAILEEFNRLQIIKKIQEAKKKTNSTALSKKKGELADLLITDAFVQRFNNELKALGASKIKVSPIRSRVSKGKVLHTLQLHNSVQNPLHDILSEGENRIVSIAAFLADVTGKNHPTPFVFDDPISSLDQDYEEAVVKRLCTIALNRQVIIFTHRLSLLGLLQDYAKKVNIVPDIICIREESWGTGEPGDTPLFAKRPDKALNQLLNDRLQKAKTLLRESGRDAYDPYVKSLCGDFRIILERMIEFDLMSGIVERYRRAVNTMGKINNLAKISVKDCTYFDELMTKYSRYEHSQPFEAPVNPPDPDELENDFITLKKWQEEFARRQPSVLQEK